MTKWININDCPPPEGLDIDVVVEHGHPLVMERVTGCRVIGGIARRPSGGTVSIWHPVRATVTHWMPSPDLPRGEVI